jgi:hypothetical protein
MEEAYASETSATAYKTAQCHNVNSHQNESPRTWISKICERMKHDTDMSKKDIVEQIWENISYYSRQMHSDCSRMEFVDWYSCKALNHRLSHHAGYY